MKATGGTSNHAYALDTSAFYEIRIVKTLVDASEMHRFAPDKYSMACCGLGALVHAQSMKMVSLVDHTAEASSRLVLDLTSG